MRRAVVLACLLACAAGLPAASLSAEEPFAGTWRVDPLKGTIHGKPQRIELKDGTYRCFSCTPPIEVKADGLKHPIKSDLEDGLSVKVESDRAVTSTYFVGDRRTYEVKATVSSDGQTRMQDGPPGISRHRSHLLATNRSFPSG